MLRLGKSLRDLGEKGNRDRLVVGARFSGFVGNCLQAGPEGGDGVWPVASPEQCKRDPHMVFMVKVATIDAALQKRVQQALVARPIPAREILCLRHRRLPRQ